MIGALNTSAGRLVLAALVACAVLGGVYSLGQRNARHAAEIEDLAARQKTIQTIERMKIETRNMPNDDLIDRLTYRGLH